MPVRSPSGEVKERLAARIIYRPCTLTLALLGREKLSTSFRKCFVFPDYDSKCYREEGVKEPRIMDAMMLVLEVEAAPRL